MANLNSPRTVRLEVTGRVGSLRLHPAMLGKGNCNHHKHETFAEFMRVWDMPFCSRMVLYISQMILDLRFGCSNET